MCDGGGSISTSFSVSPKEERPYASSSSKPSTPGSYAARAGIRPGDTLLTIGGRPINDVLDYRFYMTDTARSSFRCCGEATPYSARIKKAEYDDIGLEFRDLPDGQAALPAKTSASSASSTRCPRACAKRLYFKDDDSRLSFLFGNYITLTNLTDADIDRIIEMRISPVNVSVHTTDPALRVAMMKNPNAAGSPALHRAAGEGGHPHQHPARCSAPAGTTGRRWKKRWTIWASYIPGVQSIACVPVGLTRYREGLAELRSLHRRRRRATRSTASTAFASKGCWRSTGSGWPIRPDEFFLLAGRPIPAAGYYGEFAQLENGVGLLALLEDEFSGAFADDDGEAGRGGRLHGGHRRWRPARSISVAGASG